MTDEPYANIRTTGLRQFIGKRLLDITQHDEDEFREDGRAYVVLMFEEGGTIELTIGDDGFSYHDGNDQEESDGQDLQDSPPEEDQG